MDHKCIYCGATTDLSESDIIPDALTNARIFNKNVCRIAHNNRFSDLFESKVISELSFITNELDIKSSKGKRYASYDATVTINGDAYDVSWDSDATLFGKRILKSSDKTHILGSYEKIVNIAKDEKLVEQIDVNQIELEKTVKINTAIFFDTAMFRMVAKIAYEWYCAKNQVADFYPEFSSIVSYITEGSGTCPVSIIQSEEAYKTLSNELNLGSHALFAFEAIDRKINVIVSLFGILIYRVIVADKKMPFCPNNFLFMELCTDSSHKEIMHATIDEANACFLEYLNPQNYIVGTTIAGMPVMVPRSFSQISNAMRYPFILNAIQCFGKVDNDTIVPNKHIVDILINQIQQITQASLLHKKSVKRFVREYFREGHDPIRLNPSMGNKKSIILFYTVFTIGKAEIAKLNDDIFQQIMRDSFRLSAGEELIVTDELESQLKNEILKAENYPQILEIGAKIINEWV